MVWRHFVAMGDSLTEGWGDSYPGLEHLSWAERLARAIAPLHPGFQFANLAYRGLTSAQVRDFQLERALALQPDLVSLNAGANDIAWPEWDVEAYHARMDGMLAALSETGATLITFTLPDIWRILPNRPRTFYARAREMNDVIRQLARQYNTVFYDFWHHPEVTPPDSWGSDGVHPNGLGYLRIARAIAGVLAEYAEIEIQRESLELPAGLG